MEQELIQDTKETLLTIADILYHYLDPRIKQQWKA